MHLCLALLAALITDMISSNIGIFNTCLNLFLNLKCCIDVILASILVLLLLLPVPMYYAYCYCQHYLEYC